MVVNEGAVATSVSVGFFIGIDRGVRGRSNSSPIIGRLHQTMARRLPKRSLLGCAAALLLGACVTTDNNGKPGEGGVVEGDYVLTIEPSSGCSTVPSARFTLPVEARNADTAGDQGIQIVSTGAGTPVPKGDPIPIVEIELQYVAPNVSGGIGTTGLGAASEEGYQVWVKGIARGTVTSEPGKNGEIVSGTLVGDLAFGNDEDDIGDLGSCSSLQHRWSLRLE
jgi:hypothetical protein